MAIANILVHVDNTAAAHSRAIIAAALANAFQASITGLYVRPTGDAPLLGGSVAGHRLAETLHDEIDQNAKEARDNFCLVAGSTAFEWIDVPGSLMENAVRNSRFSDLVVVGQSPVLEGLTERHLGRHLVLHSGKPVLIVPDGCTAEPPLKSVIIGWNGSRESARAVSDAIPILKLAKSVEVVMISAAPAGAGLEPGSSAICKYLAKHGVAATETVIPDNSTFGVGGLILAYAAERNVDLIVMGAFGRSKVRAAVLGASSDKVLDETSRLVVMSH
jgi:nucleotide-binding universal stress UspA family protein